MRLWENASPSSPGRRGLLNEIHLLSIAGLLTALLVTQQALAEESSVSRAKLLTVTLEQPFNVRNILSQRIEMAPQVAGQKHYHPMPVVGYLVSGEIAFQIQGQETQMLKAGDAFFEPADAVVVRWENVGSTRAIFVANYIAADDSDELLIRVE